MKFLYTFSLVLLLVSAPPVMAQSSTLSLVEESGAIRLEAKSIHLIDLLMEIQKQSGIRFDIPEHMDLTSVTFKLQEADWQSLVSAIMKDFNKIEVWSDEPGKSYVKIMGVGNYVATTTNNKPELLAKKESRVAPERVVPERVAPEPQIKMGDPVHPEPVQLVKALSANEQRARVTARRQKLKEEREAREYVDPNHPMAKLPGEVLLEPGIMNYLLASKVDMPDGIKNKYGIDTNPSPNNYPIAPHVYNDPKLKEYLAAVGLPMPPQFPTP